MEPTLYEWRDRIEENKNKRWRETRKGRHQSMTTQYKWLKLMEMAVM